MRQPPPPGTFRIDDDQLLRAGGHVGWYATEMGLYTYSGERHLMPKKLLAAASEDLCAHDPLRKLDPRRFPRIAAAAAVCPLVVVPDDTVSPHVIHVRWQSSSNSGLICDASTGRRFEDTLDRYLLTPMAAGDLAALIAALQKPADEDGDEARRWSQWLEKAAASLEKGADDEEVRNELTTVLGTSIDRIIRAVTQGVADEDAVELAMELAWLVTSDDRAALKEWEERLDGRLRDADGIDRAEQLLRDLVSDKPTVDTPWGPAYRFVRPKVVCLGGTVLPEEPVRYFPEADPLSLQEDQAG
ncbi:MAG: hypothetical protein HY901_21945 [Deltaproteobacteria bacterium]|nr:hypothetical protein [Deltaproteobacteria bacterium]